MPLVMPRDVIALTYSGEKTEYVIRRPTYHEAAAARRAIAEAKRAERGFIEAAKDAVARAEAAELRDASPLYETSLALLAEHIEHVSGPQADQWPGSGQAQHSARIEWLRELRTKMEVFALAARLRELHDGDPSMLGSASASGQ